MEVLIDLGADVNAQDTTGDTPLAHAASDDETAACTLLLKHGGDKTIRNTAGDLPGDQANDRALKRLLTPDA